MGTSWYTWLEQGRDIKISEPIARAIGSALQFSDDEFRYFYGLLGISLHLRDVPQPDASDAQDLANLVDSLEPCPAMILDDMWNIRGANHATRLVFGLSDLDQNLLVYIFANDVFRSRCADFSRVAARAVAQFRASAVRNYDDPALERMVDKLSLQSEEFASLWHSHKVLNQARGSREEINHPEAGTLIFETQVWTLDGFDSTRLMVHLPAPGTCTRGKVSDLVRDAEG